MLAKHLYDAERSSLNQKKGGAASTDGYNGEIATADY